MNPNSKYDYCNVIGNTDVGCKRKANEDWLDSFECDNGLVAVVCDGMGGHVGGQVASHLAVDAIRSFLTSQFFDNPKEAIVQACNAANNAILQRGMQQPELAGMGSTCVMLIVRDGKVYIGSVGDSRIYFLRSKKLIQLTKDQSYVQMLVDAGQLTPEQAEHHPRKNEITNALGLQGMKPATVLEDPINPEAGDCFLLCSDGLSGMVSDREIEKVVGNQQNMSQQDRVNTLIQKARANGGLDNITCQIVEFSVTPGASQTLPSGKTKILKYGIPALIAAVLLGAGGFFAWKYLGGNKEASDDKVVAGNNKKDPIVLDLDTIVFKSKTKFLEITADTTNQRIAFKYVSKDGTSQQKTYPNNCKLSEMAITPEIGLKKEMASDSSYIIEFSDSFNEEDLSISFEKSDSVYRFVIDNPIKIEYDNPKSEDKRDAPSKGGEKTKNSQEKKGTVTHEEIQPNINDTAIVRATTGETAKKEVTVRIEKIGERIFTLHSSTGTNTKTDFYTDAAIKNGMKTESWYTYKSNGSTCIITVKCPEAAKIENKNRYISIPLKTYGDSEAYFKIRVVIQ